MAGLIGKRYGNALYEVALEKNQLDSMANQLELVLAGLADNSTLIEVLTHPNVLLDEKIKMVEQIFEDYVEHDLMGLLVLVIKKGRQAYLQEILETALENIHQAQGLVTAYVSSATDLNIEQKEQIQSKLEEQTGKQVKLACQVDEQLIGGLVIRIHDRVVDNSIWGSMQHLKRELLNTVVE